MTREIFDPRPYPIVGNAWKHLWWELSDGAWYSSRNLEAVVLEEMTCSPETVKNMLRQKAREGVLQRRTGRKKARYYRIHPDDREPFDSLDPRLVPSPPIVTEETP